MPDGPSIITSRTSCRLWPSKASRPRVWAVSTSQPAPSQVFPEPLPPSASQVVHGIVGSSCSGFACSRQWASIAGHWSGGTTASSCSRVSPISVSIESLPKRHVLPFENLGVVGLIGVIHAVFVLGSLGAVFVVFQPVDRQAGAGGGAIQPDAAGEFDVVGRRRQLVQQPEIAEQAASEYPGQPFEHPGRLIWLSGHATKVRDQRARQGRRCEKVGSCWKRGGFSGWLRGWGAFCPRIFGLDMARLAGAMSGQGRVRMALANAGSTSAMAVLRALP